MRWKQGVTSSIKLPPCCLAARSPQTWQMLAAANAIPLGHWQLVTGIAIGKGANLWEGAASKAGWEG